MQDEEKIEEIKKVEEAPGAPAGIPKKIGMVKTYAEDMTKVIEQNESGMIRKIIAEEEENEAVNKNLSPESERNKRFMLTSIVLVFLACIVLIGLVIFRNRISTVGVTSQTTPIIFTDQTQYKEIGGLNKDQLARTVLNEIATSKVKDGDVERLYLTENKRIVGLRRFLFLLKTNLDVNQINFVDDNFLLGATNKNLFVLLKTRSFIDIFPAMKAWESKMFYDLHSLFGTEINAENSYLLTKDFEDGFVNNKNARILKDTNGKLVLEYVFASDTSLIIANNDQAVKEAMSRLISGQIKK